MGHGGNHDGVWRAPAAPGCPRTAQIPRTLVGHGRNHDGIWRVWVAKFEIFSAIANLFAVGLFGAPPSGANPRRNHLTEGVPRQGTAQVQSPDPLGTTRGTLAPRPLREKLIKVGGAPAPPRTPPFAPAYRPVIGSIIKGEKIIKVGEGSRPPRTPPFAPAYRPVIG